jgi:transcriptional regulator with PAS, ATPase and Fis domain
LVSHFIKKYNQILNKRVSGISPEALSMLIDYSYPGNIRELENIIERAMIMSTQNMIEKDLFFFLAQRSSNQQTGTLKEMEKEMIKKSLIQNKGNRTKAAQCLGMSRRNLQLKLKEYDIDIKYEKENK